MKMEILKGVDDSSTLQIVRTSYVQSAVSCSVTLRPLLCVALLLHVVFTCGLIDVIFVVFCPLQALRVDRKEHEGR